MEIQLITPSPAISATTTPYATAPSSPHRFPNFFYSAPTSPIHDTSHHLHHDDHDGDGDFAFDFIGQLQPPSISAADELFHAGKIKPLKVLSAGHQPKSADSRFTQVFSPRGDDRTQISQNSPKRGRKTTTGTITRDKASRSSSPCRISDILSSEDDTINHKNSITWYNKWNLKNLLFRSASEGSATRSKSPVNKYARIRKVVDNDAKNSSFRSTESCSNSVTGSSRRVTRKVSAHEIHYTANRAVAEEMRRKTYLPYKSGLLGCLGFGNVGGGGGIHEISRGVSSVMKQRRG